MTRDEKITLMNYRLDRAEESLKAARIMLKSELYVPAMNRVYYSMFYAVQALLILHEIAFAKHGQVKGFFNREYIKTGVFPKDFGKLFNTVFEYRQKFDYVDLIIPEADLISDNINKANIFIDKISDYIKEQISSF